ncbi:FAD/NAD(P)-binding domain-containing protein [Coprinopsis marcescibilis]|uniref:FAD/NAD(P)-binding domain-containing protein n=1 Tax=Coprinopsis marcescibilis TaxID=230819 RepID=A0A5C3L0X2_COPMA|nr:FAD/NAD(P)-binding domain-containing protein [Coprinopsis marcescibilis]
MDTVFYPNTDDQRQSVKRICIIGAGPAGLAALKVVLEASQYKAGIWQPVVFEARESLGGSVNPEKPDVPPATPLYDALTTNLPHPVMSYSDFPFPPSTPVFPTANVVLKYLEAYADHFNLRRHILFNNPVLSVDWSSDSHKWIVKSQSILIEFDLVMICNGHYNVPRYPTTSGLAAWLNSGRASHSMWYRHPISKHGKTVIVVGAGPSGNDITAELLSTGHTVIHSQSGATRLDKGDLKLRGRIKQYEQDGAVTFEDGSKETGVDHCILATGYEYTYPFLSSDILNPSYTPPIPPLPLTLHNSTFNVFPLAQHIWPIQSTQPYPPTSLAFLGLLFRVSPFPLVEVQAKAVLTAFAHPSHLDLTQEAVEVMNRYQELRGTLWGASGDIDEVQGISKAWHRFEAQQQYDYRDHLSMFIESADPFPDQPIRVPSWEREMYDKKNILRATWVALEKSGEAEDWVRGVGEGGVEEWVDLLRKLLKRGEEGQQPEVPELETAKL